MNPLRILITSVGSLVGTNLLESLAELGRERFHVIGTNSLAEAPNNFACDSVHRVPPTAAGSAYRDALAAVGAAEAPELWIPTRDDDVIELARLAAERTLPGRLLVGSVASAEIICDKWLTYTFATERGLAVAPTVDTVDGALALAARHGWPLLVKPRHGYGSRGTRFVLDGDQLRRAMVDASFVAQLPIALAPDWAEPFPDPAAGWPIWFSYVDPGQYSTQWLIGPDGSAHELGATLNVMTCGRPDRSARIDDPALSRATVGYAEGLAALGWRGPLNFQARRDRDGAYHVFELAGRLAGGLRGRETTGSPETANVLATWFPERFEAAARRPADGMRVTKAWRTETVAADAIATFERDGVWRRCC